MKKNSKQQLKKKHVLIIYTGGTFGMVPGQDGYEIAHLGEKGLRKRIQKFVPELEMLAHCDIEVALNCDSAHIGPEEWLRLASLIEKKWKSYDGIVILHGTDTLAFTASALSFLLRPCLKPVILTGAQRPLASLRSDARRNLISAVEIAVNGPPEVVNRVCVFFDDRLLQGNLTRKRSATDFFAFESPKASPLAIVGTEIRYSHVKKHKPAKEIKISPVFSGRVAILQVTPAFPAASFVSSWLSLLDGLILKVFFSGTAPTHDPGFMALLKEAKRLDLPIVAVTEGSTQVPVMTATAQYPAARSMIEAGVVPAYEMTSEAAFVKASLLLGHLGVQSKVKPRRSEFLKLWNQSLAGEIPTDEI